MGELKYCSAVMPTPEPEPLTRLRILARATRRNDPGMADQLDAILAALTTPDDAARGARAERAPDGGLGQLAALLRMCADPNWNTMAERLVECGVRPPTEESNAEAADAIRAALTAPEPAAPELGVPDGTAEFVALAVEYLRLHLPANHPTVVVGDRILARLATPTPTTEEPT